MVLDSDNDPIWIGIVIRPWYEHNPNPFLFPVLDLIMTLILIRIPVTILMLTLISVQILKLILIQILFLILNMNLTPTQSLILDSDLYPDLSPNLYWSLGLDFDPDPNVDHDPNSNFNTNSNSYPNLWFWHWSRSLILILILTLCPIVNLNKILTLPWILILVLFPIPFLTPQTCRLWGPRWPAWVKLSPQPPSPPFTCTPVSCTQLLSGD